MGLFRRTNVEKLRQIGDVAGLIRALRHRDVRVREEAAIALGEIRDPLAVEPLIAAVKDRSPDVREAAADALGDLGDPAAVQPLVEALRHLDAGAAGAARALGKLGDRIAVEPLVAVLDGAKPDLRRFAARALGRLADGAASKFLISALRDPDPDVREEVTLALAELGDPEMVEPLIGCLKDPSAYVRKAAVGGLAKLGDGRAVPPLIATLDDSENDVRIHATHALAGFSDRRMIEPLRRLLASPDGSVKRSAATVLLLLGEREAVQALRENGIGELPGCSQAPVATGSCDMCGDFDDWRLRVAEHVFRELVDRGYEPFTRGRVRWGSFGLSDARVLSVIQGSVGGDSYTPMVADYLLTGKGKEGLVETRRQHDEVVAFLNSVPEKTSVVWRELIAEEREDWDVCQPCAFDLARFDAGQPAESG